MNIHLDQHFEHHLQELGCLGDQMLAMPPQRPQRQHLVRRSKTALELATGVHLLQPDRIANVGLLLEVAGQAAWIDHHHFEALAFQEVA